MSTTREWGSGIPPEDLTDLARANDEFRALWASINPPWKPSFDGSFSDILAIDYLHYEGIGFPHCGMTGATLVTAELVRRAAKLEWVRAYDGELYLADEHPSYVVICPRSRVEEIQLSVTPQFGKFATFAVRAAIDCYGLRTDADESLRELISELGDAQIDSLFRTLHAIQDKLHRNIAKRPEL